MTTKCRGCGKTIWKDGRRGSGFGFCYDCMPGISNGFVLRLNK